MTTTSTAAPAEIAARPGGPVLSVRGLSVEYRGGLDPVRACTDVTVDLQRGEILGVVGESGSGKSTLISALTRLERPPAVISSGQVLYSPAGGGPAIDLVSLGGVALRRLRWTSLSIVLQSAMDALNPVMRLGAQFADVLRTHDRSLSNTDAWQEARRLLGMVGIAADRVGAYPHELSGGMRQRATIALALACRPELVVMDEPTTAVDVVMQRQILAQVLALREELGFAVVFVTHDLSLLLEIADRIAVMYAGRVVELASARDLYRHPRHPYTQGLRDSFPPLKAPLTRLEGIPGSPPDLRALPVGCAFADRCPAVMDVCRRQRPELRHRGTAEVACHLHDEERAR